MRHGKGTLLRVAAALAAAVRIANPPDLLNDLGIAALTVGDSTAARAVLKTALYADPGEPTALENMAVLEPLLMSFRDPSFQNLDNATGE